MIEIIVPDRDEIRAIQAREDAYYWSALTENVFREIGGVGVATRNARSRTDSSDIILTRGAILADLSANERLLIEGPLNAEMAKIIGVITEPFTAQEIALKWDNAGPHQLFYPREYFKDSTAVREAEEPSRWHRRSITGQFLAGEGWDVLAIAKVSETREAPVVIAKGGWIVTGVPLFDLYVRSIAFAPLPDRYAKKISSTNIYAIVFRLIEEFLGRSSAIRAVAEPARIVRWPAAKTAAFTVRHDFDRPTSLASMIELLDFYGEVGVKASIGFLDYELPLDVIQLICRRGHEIQLHSYAKNLSGFRQQLDAVASAAGARPVGMTIHGGPSGPGFLGETHFEWATESGLDYVEQFAMQPSGGAPVTRIGPDGIPYGSPLIGMTRHHSLDKSVPKENNFATLQQQLPRALASGEYVILMNHPDKNREDLIKLIRGLDLRKAWCATQAEVASWIAQTRFAAASP